MSDTLWVCNDCGLIGSRAEAESHAGRRDHEIEDLGEETSSLVREEWRRSGDPRAVTGHALACEIARTRLLADMAEALAVVGSTGSAWRRIEPLLTRFAALQAAAVTPDGGEP